MFRGRALEYEAVYQGEKTLSSYDDEIRQALKDRFGANQLCDVGEATTFFAELAKVFPLAGSRVDWNRVPGAVEQVEKDQAAQVDRFVEFFREMRRRFSLQGVVTYVGDSATRFAIQGSVDSFTAVARVLFSIPQHHYFVGPDCSWCMCFTFEGDMAFV